MQQTPGKQAADAADAGCYGCWLLWLLGIQLTARVIKAQKDISRWHALEEKKEAASELTNLVPERDS